MPTPATPLDGATTRAPITPAVLLDEADCLFSTGHGLAAACVLHAALNARLLQLCEALGYELPIPDGAFYPRFYRHVEAIQRRKVIDKMTRNLLKKVLDVTADALHGVPCGQVRLARYLQVVREFVVTTEGRVAA